MNDDRRERVKERIDAARERVEQRAETTARQAKNAAVSLRDFVVEHPTAAVAGGIAIGGVVAALLPRKSRRTTSNEVSRLASLASDFAVAYAAKAADGAREAGSGSLEYLEDVGDTLAEQGSRASKATGKFIEHSGERLSDFSEDARRVAADFAEAAIESAREASEAAIKRLSEVTARLRQ